LIALAKVGHFARAAAECGVTQPALSAGIHQLESELGVKIVKRGKRFHGLTPQGDLVLAWAYRLQDERKALDAQLRASDEFRRTLRIGALNTTGPFTSLFTIPFELRFPDVSLQQVNASELDIQRGVHDSAFDVVISILEPKRERYLRYCELYTQEHYVFTRKGGPFSGAREVKWEDLKDTPLCLYPSETRVFDEDIYEIVGPPSAGTPRLQTNNMFVLTDHVRTGRWISILPKPVLFMVAKDREFEAIPLPSLPDRDIIGIAIPRVTPIHTLAEQFFQIATSDEVIALFRSIMDGENSSQQFGIRAAESRRGLAYPTFLICI
jgi:DNA-binding transcriptional LysR family regulator